MTRYDVLQYHIGDKEYAIGDTRVANEGDVAHLVEAGLLRKAADQAGVYAIADDLTITGDLVIDGKVDSDAAKQIEALTTERDEARAELAQLRDTQVANNDVAAQLRIENEKLQSSIITLTQERDDALALVEAGSGGDESDEAPAARTAKRGRGQGGN